MKKLTDRELKSASILDLTDDLNLMRSAMDDPDFETSEVSDWWGSEQKMFSMMDFAEHTNNTELINRLNRIFEYSLALIFNE